MASDNGHKFRNKILIVTSIISITIICINYNWRLQNNQSQTMYEEVKKSEITLQNVRSTIENTILNNTTTNITTNAENRAVNETKLKYILIWTHPHHDPLMYLGKGQETFIKKKCAIQNCFITTNKEYFKDITDFDVILFNGPEVVDKKKPILPVKRSPKQNYVFASIESSDYYPMCDNKLDGYFNISWTYKLNSDISYGYVIVRNRTGNVIGPKTEMHWMNINEMKPINDTVKHKLSSKKKLAAWLVSNCGAPSGRDGFVKRVQQHLKTLDGDWKVDIYGNCGTIRCEIQQMSRCLQIFENDYYFYFSFENSFSEDYVTEKILTPLQHYIIPVVYGTANYTRFMPDGIYLNALELGPQRLAEKMVEIVNDKEQHYQFFKWLNHYSYHGMEESPETDFHCLFCAGVNNNELMSKTTIIQNFKEWWSPPKIRPGACPARL